MILRRWQDKQPQKLINLYHGLQRKIYGKVMSQVVYNKVGGWFTVRTGNQRTKIRSSFLIHCMENLYLKFNKSQVNKEERA